MSLESLFWDFHVAIFVFAAKYLKCLKEIYSMPQETILSTDYFAW